MSYWMHKVSEGEGGDGGDGVWRWWEDDFMNGGFIRGAALPPVRFFGGECGQRRPKT